MDWSILCQHVLCTQLAQWRPLLLWRLLRTSWLHPICPPGRRPFRTSRGRQKRCDQDIIRMCLQADLTPPSGEKVILPLHLITETDPAITSVLHVYMCSERKTSSVWLNLYITAAERRVAWFCVMKWPKAMYSWSNYTVCLCGFTGPHHGSIGYGALPNVS